MHVSGTYFIRLTVTLLLLCTAPLPAEPMAAPGDKIKAQQLKLAELPGKPGRWHSTEFTLQPGKEQRFFVRGLNPAAPLSIQLISAKPEQSANVSLHRLSWIAAEYQATLQQGLFRFDGRAYGDVGIRIVPAGDSDSTATLLLWQGEPVTKALVSIYQPPESNPNHSNSPNGAAGQGSALSWWQLAVVLLLVLIVALLVALLKRKHTAALVAAMMLAGASLLPAPPLQAQQPDDKAPPKQHENPFDIPKDAKDAAVVSDKDKAASSGTADKDKPAADKPGQQGGADKDKAQDSLDGESYAERLAAAEQHVLQLAEQVGANRAELERLKLLLEQDKDNEPSADNLPPLPLSCKPPQVEGDGIVRDGDALWQNYERCQQCYAQPLADLENQLLLYERLRVIYRSTKDYVNNAITLGDKIPKPHALLENTWAAQKFSINQSFEKTKQAYDAKLPELNDKLSEILDRVGRCETDFNNNPMWRQTSGFFFYNTLATSYKRSD
ncbi:hypothetical protein [Rheinheimera nanhaiensis]|uniref:Uncharacterized protein n=1 Tax=Rheinheimera nanhaiensis E407-8 TaxID=562729 RepID=I1DUQ6_9GAMM|nr:hypothetical protein [Rheinheimera nanhaiensis]GAB57784.1 hypothetical protein RNAN_0753 [Rheinheimera nanhaiensis E407-8]